MGRADALIALLAVILVAVAFFGVLFVSEWRQRRQIKRGMECHKLRDSH